MKPRSKVPSKGIPASRRNSRRAAHAIGKGRSLRDFDLHTRIFKYPCSYLIYSEAFDDIPEPAKGYVYHRLLEVLTGREQSPDFAKLTGEDRRAILEILLATKPGLPEEWKQVQERNHLMKGLSKNIFGLTAAIVAFGAICRLGGFGRFSRRPLGRQLDRATAPSSRSVSIFRATEPRSRARSTTETTRSSPPKRRSKTARWC